MAALLNTRQPTISLFGKTSLLHVTGVLRVSPQESLRMIQESVALLKGQNRRVPYDAEHFFDGCLYDKGYAFETLRAAARSGADMLVLCDTNGGALPEDLRALLGEAMALLPQMRFGIPCHNDLGLAVAGTLGCLQAGAVMAQGTMGGVEERCGNADLCSLISTLALKLGYEALPQGNLPLLTQIARAVADIMNLQPDPRPPYAGYSAFAHKGGMHIDGVRKNQMTFEHAPPESVGNRRRFVLREQAGCCGVYVRLKRLLPKLERDDPRVKAVTQRLKRRGMRGYAYESANGSFDLMALETLGMRKTFLEMLDFHILSGDPKEGKGGRRPGPYQNRPGRPPGDQRGGGGRAWERFGQSPAQGPDGIVPLAAVHAPGGFQGAVWDGGARPGWCGCSLKARMGRTYGPPWGCPTASSRPASPPWGFRGI